MPRTAPNHRQRDLRRRRARVGAGALALCLTIGGCAGAPAGAPGATGLAESSSIAGDTPSSSRTAGSDEPEMLTAAPDEHSEVGTVVAGFPLDLLPLPPDAVVLVTTAVPLGDEGLAEVSLNLQTDAPAAEVLDLYRDALVAAGFTEVPVQDAALAAESTFIRSGGDELVSIGVLDEQGVRTVTIGGRVRTEP
ncbi:MAG TPA: hypothetical protein VN257_10940 [Actinotalea sp.]|nr:hypothetical protein [Actinotalea sp.]